MDLNIDGVSPPVIFRDPNEVGADVSLGPKNVSAIVSIKATTSPQNLTANSGFDIGPDEWYILPGNYINQGVWMDTYQGRNGIIQLYGEVPYLTMDTAYIVQNVTIPLATLESLTLKIGYYKPSNYLWYCYLYVGLYNTTSGSSVWSNSISCTYDSWEDVTFNVPADLVVPGGTYLLYVGISVATYWYTQDVYIYYDYIQMEAITRNPSYTGLILEADSLGEVYYGLLQLNSFTYTGNVNVSIWLRNQSLIDTQRIIIMNNNIISNKTSVIMFNSTTPRYYSLSIRIDTGISTGSTCTLELVFSYKTFDESVYVNYTLMITITDPQSNYIGINYSLPQNPVPLLKFPYNVTIYP